MHIGYIIPVCMDHTWIHYYFLSPNAFADRVRELSSASGFDVNAAVDGRSPLHFAADYGQLEVIEFLVGKVI